MRGKKMIKLGDLILASYSNMAIMDYTFEAISLNPCRVKKLKIINPDILECEVERIEAIDNRIRVWLKENENE